MNRRLWVTTCCIILLGAVETPIPGSAAEPPTAAAVPAVGASDWPQFRYGPAHTGYNQTETTISAANVAGLRLTWTGQTGSPIRSSAAVADGVVYVGSRDGKLYAFAVGCAVGGGACTPLWTGRVSGPISSSPAVADGVVYVESFFDGELYAFAVGCAAGGGVCTPLWVGDTNGSTSGSSPAVADGVVYVASDNLQAFAVGCNSGGGTCTPLWTGGIGDGSDTSPAVADGVVYVGSRSGDLYAFAAGCSTGGGTCTPLWTGLTGTGVWSSPAVADGVVYVGSGRTLYAFAAGCGTGGGTCAPLWTAETDGYIDSSPAVADGVVYVGSGNYDGPVHGRLYAFAVGRDPSGGTCSPLWTGETGDVIWSSPAVGNDVVYASSEDGRLYAFAVGCGADGRSCTPLWTTETGGPSLSSSPAIAAGVVYIGSGDGRLYAFDLFHGDVTQPVISRAPQVAGVVPSTLGSGSTLLTWKGSDGAGSGIVAFDLQQSKDGGSWASIATTATTSVTRSLVFGHSYRYRVRAHDRAGNVGAWAAGASFVPTLVQSTPALVRYPAGTWHTQSTSHASGGATRWSTSTGARARFSFTGRAVAWVTSTGPTRGRVRVYVDGTYRTTVDLHANSTRWKQVIFSASWASKSTHTIELRSALASHRIDVDAFVVYK